MAVVDHVEKELDRSADVALRNNAARVQFLELEKVTCRGLSVVFILKEEFFEESS